MGRSSNGWETSQGTDLAMTDRHQAALAHVLWLGGSPCSGKSSIARLLADRYGLRTYSCDEAFGRQRQQLTAAGQPTLYKWTHTPWAELWMQPAKVLLAEAIAAYREHLDLVVADLRHLPASEPVLAEGTCLLPDEVQAFLPGPAAGIWLVPTEVFQRCHYPRRGAWVQEIVNQCPDPQQALQNWMDRDVAFAAWLAGRVQALGLELLVVDGRRSIVENAEVVARHFGLSARPLP
jgi:hypothetical protein